MTYQITTILKPPPNKGKWRSANFHFLHKPPHVRTCCAVPRGWLSICESGGLSAYTADFEIIQNDSKTIPQSPLPRSQLPLHKGAFINWGALSRQLPPHQSPLILKPHSGRWWRSKFSPHSSLPPAKGGWVLRSKTRRDCLRILPI